MVRDDQGEDASSSLFWLGVGLDTTNSILLFVLFRLVVDISPRMQREGYVGMRQPKLSESGGRMHAVTVAR